jgi:hypothetical protein
VVSDIPPNENPQVNSKGHGKTNKDKPLEVKASDVLSIAGPGLSTPNTGSQNTEQVDHKMTSTNESAVHKDGVPAEANGTSTQSGSANDVKNSAKEQAYTKGSNVQNDSKEQAQATVNTGHNDAKKQAHTAGNNTQNDINEQAHGTNSNVQNMKKQEHTISSSNQSAHNDPVSHSVYTDSTSESVKNDDSTGKSISSDSKSNTISQPENKSSAGYVLDQGTEKKNDDDEFIPTDENGNEDQVTDVAGNPNDDEDQEVGKNTNNQGNFHTYCLIKTIFILAVFFFCLHTYTHTHTHSISNVECWFSALNTLWELGHLIRYSEKAASWMIDD